MMRTLKSRPQAESWSEARCHGPIPAVIVLAARVLIGILLVTAASAAPAGPGPTIDAQTVLDRALKTLNDRPPLSCDAEITVDLPSDAGKPGQVTGQRYLERFRQQGEKLDLIEQRSDTVDGKESVVMESRGIWNGLRFLHDDQPTEGVSHIAYFSRKPSFASVLTAYGRQSSFLDGYLGDSQNWAVILRDSGNAALQQAPEEVDKASCLVLEASTKHGYYKVWVDPEKGYNLRKAVVTKKGDDLYGGTPLSSTNLESATFALAGVEFQEVDGIWVPIKGTFDKTQNVTGKGGPSVWRSTAKCVRSNVVWNPDFDKIGAFHLDLPEGTPVRDEDFPGIRYEWHGDSVAPAADSEVVAMIVSQNKGRASQATTSSATQPGPAHGEDSKVPLSSDRSSPAVASPVGPVVHWGWLLLVAAVMGTFGLVIAKRVLAQTRSSEPRKNEKVP